MLHNAYRDDYARRLGERGFDVQMEEVFDTSRGPRRVDVVVRKNGKTWLREIKTGSSRNVIQELKDAEIVRTTPGIQNAKIRRYPGVNDLCD